MSALQQQLEAAGIAQYTGAPHKAARYGGRASFLFDGVAALDVDLATLFEIGRNGIDELLTRDPTSFSPFVKPFFSVTASQKDRTLCTQQENDKMDQQLSALLWALSPHFMTKPAHKVLEWLIRRFRIHELNVPSVIECMLPYHETSLFTQMLQLLAPSLRKKPCPPNCKPWQWLAPVAKTGAPLTRDVIVQRVIKDTGLLRMLCELGTRSSPNGRSRHTELFAVVSVETLRLAKGGTEAAQNVLKPVILKGIGSKAPDELRMAATMVLCELARHVTLESEAVVEVLEALGRGGSKNWSATATLQAIAHICKYQKISELPKRCLGHLIKIPDLTALLVDLSTRGFCEMLSAYTNGLSANALGNHNYLRLLEEALVSLPLSPIVAQMLTPHLSAFLCSSEGEDGSELVQLLLRHCGQRYSAQVDEALRQALDSHKSKAHKSKLVQLLDCTWSEGARRMEHTIVSTADGNSTTLYLALEHPAAAVRLSAMNCVLEAIRGAEGLEFSAIPQPLANAFAMRLKDEDSTVVSAALSQPKLLLQADLQEVEQSLVSLASRSECDVDGKLAAKALVVLCRHILPLGRPQETVNAVAGTAVRGMMPRLHEKGCAGAMRVMRQAAELHDYCPIFGTLRQLHQQLSESAAPKSKKSDTKVSAAAPSRAALLHSLAKALSVDGAGMGARIALYNEAACLEDKSASATMLLALAFAAKHSYADAAAAANVLQREFSTATAHSADLSPPFSQAAGRTLEQQLEKALTADNSAEWLVLASSLVPLVLAQLEGSIQGLTVAVLTPVVGGFHCGDVAVYGSNGALEGASDDHLSLAAVIGVYLGLAAVCDVEAVQQQLQVVIKCFEGPAAVLRFLSAFWLGPHRAAEPLLQVRSLQLAAMALEACSDAVKASAFASFLPVLCSEHTAVRLASSSCIELASVKQVSKGSTNTPFTMQQVSQRGTVEFTSASKAELQTIAQFSTSVTGSLVRDDKAALERMFMSNTELSSEALPLLLSHVLASGGTSALSVLLQASQRIPCPRKMLFLQAGMKLSEELMHKVVPLAVLGVMPHSAWGKDRQLFDILLNVLTAQSASKESAQCAVERIDSDFYTSLPQYSASKAPQRGQLLQALCQAAGVGVPSAAAQMAALPLEPKVMLLALQNDRLQPPAENDAAAISNVCAALVTALPAIELSANAASQVQSPEQLCGALLALLQLLNCAPVAEGFHSSEYAKQLLFKALLVCASSADLSAAQVAAFDVQQIVQCARAGSGPARSHALELLSQLASKHGQQVVEQSMPLFTISLESGESEATYNVLYKALAAIVPAACQSDQMRPEQVVTLFLDSLASVPSHRRVGLLGALVRALGTEHALDMTVSKLVAAHEGAAAVAQPLMLSFSCGEQVNALSRMLASTSNAIAQCGKNDIPKSARETIVQLLLFVAAHMSSPQFDVVDGMDESCAVFAEQLMELLRTASEALPGADKNAKRVAKFWKSVNKATLLILGKLNSLLSAQTFVNVTSQLLKHAHVSIQRRALEQFNLRVAESKDTMSAHEKRLFVSKIEDLEGLLHKKLPKTAGEAERRDEIVNCQTALWTMDILVQNFGANEPATFVPAFPGIVSLIERNDAVCGSALVCVGSMVAALGVRTLPQLPQLMPLVLGQLANAIQNQPNPLAAVVLKSALQCLATTLEHLAQFMTKYLPEILDCVLHQKLACPAEQGLMDKAKHAREALAVHPDATALLPAVIGHFRAAVAEGSTAALLDMVAGAVRKMSDSEVRKSSIHNRLFKFFLVAFDLRKEKIEHGAAHDITATEGAAIQAFVALLLRLSEKRFRPLFLKLCEWALEAPVDGDVVLQLCIDSEGDNSQLVRMTRSLTFFRLVDAIASSLKGIFVPFFGHLLDSIVLHLAAENTPQITKPASPPPKKRRRQSALPVAEQDCSAMQSELVGYLADSLHKCFLYDSSGFLNDNRFDRLLGPLVSQIGNTLGGDVIYRARIEAHLMPCLVQMAVTIHDDTKWRMLAHAVLQHTRDAQACVRSAALWILQQLFVTLGEPFLVLLPETISYLSELLEDEEEDIEKQCRGFIKQLEELSGENLQEQFS